MITYNRSYRGVSELFLGGSIILIVLHIYIYYFALFADLGMFTHVTDEVMIRIYDTWLFDRPYYSLVLALVLLLLGICSSTVRSWPAVSMKRGLAVTLVGLFSYSGFTAIECRPLASKEHLVLSTLFAVLGWVVLLKGGLLLMRRFSVVVHESDVFGRQRSGFPQEEARLSTEFSLHLKAWYHLKGRVRKSWINLVNPRRGVLVMGSPGSGKTWFIVEPLLRQLMKKGFALFVYDFKYDALTSMVWSYFRANRERFPPGMGFFSINFTDLSRSHRCNLLEPSTLEYVSDALAASRTILLSMNKTWVNRQGDFFVESPINFVGALIWFLRKYKDGMYCTLPHVIELSKTPYAKLFELLGAEPEIATLIDPFVQAFANKSFEMLDGQLAGAKIPLGRLSSPDLYYVLTGSDFSLDINNPAAPKIFCLGGDPSRIEALAPVISLYMDRLARICNQPGRYPCALVCDEFATVRSCNMATIVATGRSNNIVPILAVQDVTQLKTQYSHDEAETLLNISGNVFCGQVGGATAKWIGDRFPKILQERKAVTVNSSDVSVSSSQQWETTVSQATVSALSSGEFLGVTADEPGREVTLKSFHAKIVREEEDLVWEEMPVVKDVSAEVLQEQYGRVKKEVENLVNEELGRISKR